MSVGGSVVRGVPGKLRAMYGNDTFSTVRSTMLMNIAEDTSASDVHADRATARVSVGTGSEANGVP